MTNQEAKKVLNCSSLQTFCLCKVAIDGKMLSMKEALDMGIKALESQKTGHWIVYAELTGEWEGTKKYACDKCCEKVGVFKSNFCPNCGAKMEGE